ncbi:MAG: SMP-30/gluconolactonase/LRE family protein [Hyphomicrobiales bacterium]|nr:SMP-30/gluconolactonase/LRE family protein [Hyphomicrobiales bacterium]
MAQFGEIDGAKYLALDDRFRDLFVGHMRVERLWTGARWAEGPVWFAAHRTVVWSDIPNNRMMRLDEVSGQVSVFRQPSSYSNGNTIDASGRQITCEHQTRRVTRTEHDGTITVLADRFEGKRFNSPNDVAVKSDGSIWFTDPDYGILSNYEGDRAVPEIGGCNVYRIDPSGAVTAVATDFVKPNGIAFSPDERFLFVADTGRSHVANGPAHIRRFEISADGSKLGRSIVYAECTAGLFDGFRFDTAGNLWSSAGDGVHVYEPGGTLIGKILIPEIVANVTFGGVKRNRLFICATTSLYAAYTTATGAARG